MNTSATNSPRRGRTIPTGRKLSGPLPRAPLHADHNTFKEHARERTKVDLRLVLLLLQLFNTGQGIRVQSLSRKIIAGSEWNGVRSTDLLTYGRSASSIRTALEIFPLSASARKEPGLL
jgi:hypothetical protein